MKITDAIRTARSTYEIQFLLTDYLDALWYREATLELPGEITALPLGGIADIRIRALCLGAAGAREGTHPDSVIGETRAVFAAAITRLDALAAEPAAG